MNKAKFLFIVILLGSIFSPSLFSQDNTEKHDVEKLIFGVRPFGYQGVFVEKRIVRNVTIYLGLYQDKGKYTDFNTNQTITEVRSKSQLGLRYYFNTQYRGKKEKRILSNSADYFTLQIGRAFDTQYDKRFQQGMFDNYIDYYEIAYGINRNLGNILKKQTNKHLQRVNFSLRVGMSFPVKFSEIGRKIDQFQIPYFEQNLSILLHKVKPYSKPSEHNAPK